jgi:hypothetical protein
MDPKEERRNLLIQLVNSRYAGNATAMANDCDIAPALVHSVQRGEKGIGTKIIDKIHAKNPGWFFPSSLTAEESALLKTMRERGIEPAQVMVVVNALSPQSKDKPA